MIAVKFFAGLFALGLSLSSVGFACGAKKLKLAGEKKAIKQRVSMMNSKEHNKRLMLDGFKKDKSSAKAEIVKKERSVKKAIPGS